MVSAAAIIGVGFLAVWTIIDNITASLFLTIWRGRSGSVIGSRSAREPARVAGHRL